MNKFQISKRGFTLVELMIVIAIIGILSGIVMVSSKSSMDKSRKASALTTADTTLPELVTCGDDDGIATNTVPSAGTGHYICCTSTACAAAKDGHTETWPDISKSKWSYTGSPTGTVILGTYKFTLTKDGGSGTGDDLITCDMVKNGCE